MFDRSVLATDRIERAALIAYAVLFLTLAVAASLLGVSEWRFDLGRALDRAGLPLFYAAPVLGGVCIIVAQRRVAGIAGVAPSLPHARLATATAWVLPVVVAICLQAIAWVTFLGVAWRSGGGGSLSVTPFLLQISALVIFGICGAAVGTKFRTPLLAGAAPLTWLAIALLIPQTRLREFASIGTGAFDLTFFNYTKTFWLTHVALAVAAIFCLVPIRHRRGVIQSLRTTGIALAVLAMVSFWLGTPNPIEPRKVAQECVQQVPVVCGPEVLDLDVSQVATTMQSFYDQLPTQAQNALPKKWQLVGVGATVDDRGIANIEYSSEMRNSADSMGQAVATAIASPARCVGESNVDQQWALGSAVLRGHVEYSLDVTPSNTYPTDIVHRLEVLPAAERESIVEQVTSDVWQCRPANLQQLGV